MGLWPMATYGALRATRVGGDYCDEGEFLGFLVGGDYCDEGGGEEEEGEGKFGSIN